MVRCQLCGKGDYHTTQYWHRKRQDAYPEVIRESLGGGDDSALGSEMDQTGTDSDEGDDQPPPKVPEGKRVNAIRLRFDAMGKDSNPTAAWHLLKFMEATSLSDYCGGWIRGVAVQPRTYYTKDEVVKYAKRSEAVSRREKEGDIRKLEKEIKAILRVQSVFRLDGLNKMSREWDLRAM